MIVSDTGEIIINGKVRTQRTNKDGYKTIGFIKPDGNQGTARVARLVALAFIPNPNNLEEVNHKDYDRTNDSVDNLEWISHADNVRYSICNKPDICGENNPNYGNHKLSEIYAADKQYAKEKQGRPREQNGRCKPIEMTDRDGNMLTFSFIGACCEYIRDKYSPNTSIDAIRTQIGKSIREHRCYKGLSFKYI